MTKSTAPIQWRKGAIEKRIWGHRLYDEQSGMMTLLEFLCVLQNRTFESQVANPNVPLTEDNALLSAYYAPQRPFLRSLLFNNPYIEEIYTHVADPWIVWKDHFIGDSQNQDIIQENRITLLSEKLNEFKTIFDDQARGNDQKSFEAFARVIRLLRYSGINLQSGKRWTSRFVFPWGRNCLYLDSNSKGSTTDRRFFGRNGELLFMLLCFAEKRDELSRLINQKLLDSGNDLDRICEALTLGADVPHRVWNDQGEGCILPLDCFDGARRRINILCEDLIRVFSLPIPTPDIVKHTVILVSLNFLCYFLEQSRYAIEQFSPAGTAVPSCIIPCEALQKPTSDIRRLSKRYFEINQDLSLNAVRAYYEYYAGAASESSSSAQEDLEAFTDPVDESNSDEDSLSGILETHRGHWGPSLHRFLARDCGLATKLCTNSLRYAPSDDLIETLASIIVPVERKRLLFTDFLAEAYERYGLVFAEQEFRKAGVTDTNLIPNNSEFEANKRRLQAKFLSLGLLDALSDGFEFVLNPYKA